MFNIRRIFLCVFQLLIGILASIPFTTFAQKSSIVQVHADKSSGYGVACGGPDLIVTALHVVSGKSTIMVVWQGKSAYAKIEKIYKPSDLALLRLQTPLGIPSLTLYSGEPPYDTNINFWEVPVNTTSVSAKTTVLEERTSLAKISPRVANNPTGLSKALCSDGGQYYPGMNTEVINFKEPNIRKAHSGSPLTYDNKILGMVDGGAKLVDGKACVWAIPAADFNKLFNQGTPLSKPMQSCDQAGIENKYMYSGMRSDNPLLSPEEISQAKQFENPMNISTGTGDELELYHDYRMSFGEVYETLFDDEKKDLTEMLDAEESISLDELDSKIIDLYVEDLTGITVMIPADCNLSRSADDYGTLITTSSPGGLITMSIYISPNESMDNGIQAMSSFKSYLANDGMILQPKDEDVDDFTDDEDNPYYSEHIDHEGSNQNGDVQSGYYADLIINDGDFLAVIVTVNDWAGLDTQPNELMYFYLMETCASLCDFTIY
ncbi:MAG: trypsin-like serine protease [Saprospiraceae bacterium]